MQTKPATAVWQPARAPSGCLFYLPLAEGAGLPRDLCGRAGVSSVGAPSWSAGALGPQLGGFTSSNYLTADGAGVTIGTATYPRWCAAMVSGSVASQGDILMAANSSSLAYFRLGQKASGNVFFDMNGSTTGFAVEAAGTGIAAGVPHVVMGVSWRPTSHALYWDGRSIATSSTDPGAITVNQFSVGVLRWRGLGPSEAYGATVLAVALGTGAVPDPLALATDWLSGQFAAVRPRRRAVTFLMPRYYSAALLMGA